MVNWLALIKALLNRGACWDDQHHTAAHTNRCTLN
jgi:hypothetical protein